MAPAIGKNIPGIVIWDGLNSGCCMVGEIHFSLLEVPFSGRAVEKA